MAEHDILHYFLTGAWKTRYGKGCNSMQDNTEPETQSIKRRCVQSGRSETSTDSIERVSNLKCAVKSSGDSAIADMGQSVFIPTRVGSEDTIKDVCTKSECIVDSQLSTANTLFPGNARAPFLSIVSDPPDVKWLVDVVPLSRRTEHWQLLYSTARDGISLHTLLRCNEGEGPALLLVRDGFGGVFGAYTSDRWRREKVGRTYGAGEAFVFTVKPQRTRHSWTQANYLFQSGNTESISIGGGSHFALWLDGDLLFGTSGTCETFGSPCLSSSAEFSIEQLEVWGFAPLNRLCRY